MYLSSRKTNCACRTFGKKCFPSGRSRTDSSGGIRLYVFQSPLSLLARLWVKCVWAAVGWHVIVIELAYTALGLPHQPTQTSALPSLTPTPSKSKSCPGSVNPLPKPQTKTPRSSALPGHGIRAGHVDAMAGRGGEVRAGLGQMAGIGKVGSKKPEVY